MGHLEYQKQFRADQRPSTSAGAFMRNKEDLKMISEEDLMSGVA